MSLEVVVYDSFERLDAAVAARWDQLARTSSPFLTREFLRLWWKHYGFNEGRQRYGQRLLLVVVMRAGRAIGIAPWYRARTIGEGTVIRWLGSGQVCGDYMTILADDADRTEVAGMLADWLVAYPDWDLLELDGVRADDAHVAGFAEQLRLRGVATESMTPYSGWRIDLQDGWDGFLAKLSKSYRRTTRHKLAAIEAGEFTIRIPTTAIEFDTAWESLIELHTKRRAGLGDAGCFASRRFTEFHHDFFLSARENGGVEFVVVEHQGRPISVDYLLRDAHGSYGYQSGIDPDFLDVNPGHYGLIGIVRRACARGAAFVDLLRGDEPYKAYWRAAPRPLSIWRMVPNRTLPLLRNRVRHVGASLKRWVKTNLLESNVTES